MADSDSETDLPLSSRKKAARKKKAVAKKTMVKKVPVKRIRKKKIKKYPAEKLVECPDCGMRFYWLSKLKDHQRSHTGEKPYECDVCHKRFSQTYSLKTHKLIHTDEKPFKCSFCPYACRDTSTLRKHHYRHMGLMQKYNCNMCSETFTKKYVLKGHIAEVHLQVNLRTHKCEQCGKMFKNTSDVTKHIKQVHERAFETTCPICNKYVSSVANLKNHMLSHISEKPYMCDVPGCDKRYKDKSSLVKHSRLHEPNKQYPCTECGTKFTRLHRLSYHMLKVHQRSKHVECDYCGQKFYSKRYLILHIARKHDERRKRYICDSCGFVAKNKPGMVIHIRFGHNDIMNDNQCNLCRKTYKKHEYLKIHYKRTHNIAYKSFREKNVALGIKLNNVRIKTEPKDSDEEMDQMIEGRCIKNGDKDIVKTKKPYKNPVNLNLFKCDLCGRFFKKKPRLRNHMLKVHERVKSVPCDQCGLKFFSKNYLIAHMYKKHMRENEYICNECGYKTNYKPSIALHVKYGHIEKYQCSMCKKKFKWLENIKFHYSEVHKTSYSAAVARQKQQLQNVNMKNEQENYQEQIDLFEIEKHELQDIPLTRDGSATIKGLIQRGGVRSVPEKIFEDFCSGHIMYVPEGVSRDAARDKRRKQDIGLTDRTLEAKAHSNIEKLMSVARKKRAFEQLETARKLYNERMENIFKRRKENSKIETTGTIKRFASDNSKIKPSENINTIVSESAKVIPKDTPTKSKKTKQTEPSNTRLDTKIKHSMTSKIWFTENYKIGSDISKVLSLKEPVIQLTDISKINKNTAKIKPSKAKNDHQKSVKTQRLENTEIQYTKTPSTKSSRTSKVKTSKVRHLDTSKTKRSDKINVKTKDQDDGNDEKLNSKRNKITSQKKIKYTIMSDVEDATLPINSGFESNKITSLDTRNNGSDNKISDDKLKTSVVDNNFEANMSDEETAQGDSDATYVSDLEDDDEEMSELTKNNEVDDGESLQNLLEELEKLSAEPGNSSNVKQIYLEGKETTVDEILTEYLESDFEGSDDGLTNNEICDEILENENVTKNSQSNAEEVDMELESCCNEINNSDLVKMSSEKLPVKNASDSEKETSPNSKCNITKELENDHDYAKDENTRQIELEFLQCHEKLKEKSSDTSEEDNQNTSKNQNNNVILNDDVTLLLIAEENDKSDRRKQKIELREDLPSSPPKPPHHRHQIPLKVKKKRIRKTKKKDVMYENFDSATPLVFEIPKSGERSRKQKLQIRECTENEEPLVFMARKIPKTGDTGNTSNKSKLPPKDVSNDNENDNDDDNISVKEENESDEEINKNNQKEGDNNTSGLLSKYKVLVQEVLRTFNDPADEDSEMQEGTINEEIDKLILKENFSPLVDQTEADNSKDVQSTIQEIVPSDKSENTTESGLEMTKSNNYENLVSEVLKSIDDLVGENTAQACIDKSVEDTENDTNVENPENVASLNDNKTKNQNKTSQKNVNDDNQESQKLLNTNIDTKETKEYNIKRSNRKRKKNRKYFNDSDEKVDPSSNSREENISESNMLNNCDTWHESEDMVDRIKSRRTRNTNKKYFSDSNDDKNDIEQKHSAKNKINVKDKNSVKNKDNSKKNSQDKSNKRSQDKSSSINNNNDNKKKSSDIEDSNKKIEKLIFSTHQCYVCFKVFASKDKLIEHCKTHFGIDRQRSLKKCPLCDFTCTAGFSRHMKKIHDVSIKIPYARIQEELNGDDITYYFEVNDPNFKRIEVIPSVKNLNRRAMVKIDEEKREKQAKIIAKHKLVKKGNEWVVEKEEINVDNVEMPELDANLNISDKISDKNAYFDNLKKLYHVSKKTGKKMLFPCKDCDKVCQNLAALKLHNRKHEKNPAPFAPKVWKHKLENPNDYPTRPKIDKSVAIENKKKYFKHRVEKITKKNVNEVLQVNDKHAKPRPIKNNHKCDPELQEFYRNNIRGGDIEFWQFLKIFNKMGRDNINDFKDLEGRNEYGIIESGALH